MEHPDKLDFTRAIDKNKQHGGKLFRLNEDSYFSLVLRWLMTSKGGILKKRVRMGIRVILCFTALFFFSCASRGNVYRDLDLAVSQNDFERGVEAIRRGQEARRPLYPEGNAVSLYLDKGLLEHYAGNYRNSSQDLQEAERLIEEAFTKSITAEIASYIVNDNTKAYPGEDYEDIYLNVFNALNYYHNNDLEGAMVEIRKITLSNGKLDMLARKYEGKNKATKEYAENRLSSMGSKDELKLPPGKQVDFSNSALARYLSALFYQGQGNMDDARIEFDQLRSAFSGNPNVYYNAIPPSAADAQNIPRGKARLNIIGFTGLSPIKEERISFPLGPNYPLKLPELVERPSGIDRIEVNVHNQGVFNLELLEDMGAVAEAVYLAHYENIYLKTFIRTFLKYAAAEVAAISAAAAMERQAGGLAGSLMGLGVSLLARAGVDASEKADIRMGRFFPDKAYIGGVNLDPGTYQVTVAFYHRGEVIAKSEFRDQNIRLNELNLIEAVCLK